MGTPATSHSPSGSAPAPANGSAVSPVEYVRSLPLEDQEAVFVALIREAIRVNGGHGLIPIQAADGEGLGYYVPPAAAAELFERYGPKLTEEDRERTRQALASLDRTFDFNEFLDELNREDAPQG